MATPPWSLTGDGYIFLYRFPRQFVEKEGFVPDYLEGKFRGGFGAVMLVDYHKTPVGPYREVLFIPGLFEHAGHKLYSITKIYVSTIDSVIWGQDNWGIPKELADFTVTSTSHSTERVRIAHDGMVFLEVSLRSRRLKMPANTRWSPVQPALIQQHKHCNYITRPNGKGKLALAQIQDLKVDAGSFPDVSQLRPLAAFRATDFRLNFPVPRTLAEDAPYET